MKTNSQELRKWANERGIYDIEFNLWDQIKFILEELLEMVGVPEATEESEALIKRWKKDYGKFSTNEYEIVDAANDIQVFACNLVQTLGYDNDKTLKEVIKELNSRVGNHNPETGKWEKDKSPEAIAKHYKADFSGCKYIELEESETITHVNGLKENDSCFYIESNDAKKFLRLYRQIDSEQYLQITDVQSVVVNGESYVGLYK